MTAIGSAAGKPHESLSTSVVGTSNQLAGFGYDALGNMTSNGLAQYVYDAENRLIWNNGTPASRYIYDGNGQRVEKCAAATATTACPTSGTNGTLYFRGTGSDTLDETDLSGNPVEEYIFFNGQRIARRDISPSGATVAMHYYFSDHLGSHGVVENATGTACEQDIDYYPYGGVQQDNCATPVSQNYKFTGKERDPESGLDNLGKRYNASSIGRLMSADPFIPFNLKKDRFQEWISNPQHWNKYAYALNNPLLYVDPSGMTETIYYFLNSNLTDEQKQYFKEHKTDILNAVADKLKQAGIKDVVFKDGSSLNKSQVNSILTAQPKGVAFLNFANRSYAGQAPSRHVRRYQGIRSAVYVGNLQAGNPSLASDLFRVSEVSGHELGHGMDFYSRGETMSFIEFLNKDLMNEGQAMPKSSSPRYFDMSIPQNRQAVDEINKLPEYNPQ